jgi:putative transposase
MTLKHYFEKGAIYYVTSVTYKRRKIFTDVTTARFLLATIMYHKYILEFNLFGYVIMPDHFHILIQPSERYSLAQIMKYIKGNFARKYNEWHYNNTQSNHCSWSLSSDYNYNDNVDYKRDYRGWVYIPVWQEGYYETVMRAEKDVLNRLNYMHNNPVRKGLVDEPSKYEFSSWHQYFGKTREKIQIPIDKLLR